MIKVLTRKRRNRATYQLYFVDPLTNREVSKTSDATTAKDAERAARDWERELQQFRGEHDSGWEYFRYRFRCEHLSTLSDKGRSSYLTALSVYEREMSPRDLRDVTSSSISLFQSNLYKRKPALSVLTIGAYLTHLRGALNWACKMGMIQVAPTFVMPRMGKRRLARGRALTATEYQAILAACDKRCVNPEQWKRFIALLWFTGLRLSEACALSWDSPPVQLCLDTRPFPTIVFYAEGQKSRTDEVIPIAPDAFDWLSETHPLDRHGLVAPLVTQAGQQFSVTKVGLRLAELGELAKVKTLGDSFATAHDFRRSFGSRWAMEVRPLTLKKLMRHTSIETTLKYYVGLSAEDAGNDLWKNVPRNVPKTGSVRLIAE